MDDIPSNPRGVSLARLTIGVAAILPLITTVILLWQHSSESGYPAVLGRWTYFYFIIAISPTIVTLPVFVFFWLRHSRNTINLAVAILSLYVVLVPLEAATYTKATNFLSPQFIFFIPDSCVQRNMARNQGFLRATEMIQFDGVPGHHVKPNSAFTAWTPDEEGHTRLYSIKLDRNGFNNEESIAGLSSIDLAIVGDSFTFGAVPREQNFVSVASQLLNQPILNLGAGGNGPQQQRWAVEQIGLSYQPKVVVWQFYQNDPRDAVMMDKWLADYRGMPYGDFLLRTRFSESTLAYRKGECRRISLNSPFLLLGLVQQTRTQISASRSQNPLVKVQVAGDREGAIPGYLEMGASALGPPNVCNYPQSISEWQDTATISTRGSVIELEVPMRQALELVETEIRDLTAFSRSAGFELIIMPVPTKNLVYENQILDYIRSTTRDLDCPDGSSPRFKHQEYRWIEWLQVTAAKHDLQYLDLLSYLRREAADGRDGPFYYPLDFHLNDAGNAATGRFLHQELKGMFR